MAKKNYFAFFFVALFFFSFPVAADGEFSCSSSFSLQNMTDGWLLIAQGRPPSGDRPPSGARPSVGDRPVLGDGVPPGQSVVPGGIPEPGGRPLEGGKSVAGAPLPQDSRPQDAYSSELKQKLEQQIRDKISEGYYVRNPTLFKKAFNNTLGRVRDWWKGYKGGQCGEFGEWGKEWLKEIVPPGTLVDDVVIVRSSGVNHRANKIILPNGEEFIIDYWESFPEGKPKIYTPIEWVEKWKEKLGEPLWGDLLIDIYSPQQTQLINYIESYGEEKGIELYRRIETKRGGDSAEQAESVIKWWKMQKNLQ